MLAPMLVLIGQPVLKRGTGVTGLFFDEPATLNVISEAVTWRGCVFDLGPRATDHGPRPPPYGLPLRLSLFLALSPLADDPRPRHPERRSPPRLRRLTKRLDL